MDKRKRNAYLFSSYKMIIPFIRIKFPVFKSNQTNNLHSYFAEMIPQESSPFNKNDFIIFIVNQQIGLNFIFKIIKIKKATRKDGFVSKGSCFNYFVIFSTIF